MQLQVQLLSVTALEEDLYLLDHATADESTDILFNRSDEYSNALATRQN